MAGWGTMVHEIVLVEGTLADIQELVDGAALVVLWDEMYLPPWLRTAWRPLIESARAAALPMPLDPLQELIARTALGLLEARTLALAGRAA